jgi:hypothetical protein
VSGPSPARSPVNSTGIGRTGVSRRRRRSINQSPAGDRACALGKPVSVLADPAGEDKPTEMAEDSLLRDCPSLRQRESSAKSG